MILDYLINLIGPLKLSAVPLVPATISMTGRGRGSATAARHRSYALRLGRTQKSG